MCRDEILFCITHGMRKRKIFLYSFFSNYVINIAKYLFMQSLKTYVSTNKSVKVIFLIYMYERRR